MVRFRFRWTRDSNYDWVRVNPVRLGFYRLDVCERKRFGWLFYGVGVC